MPSRNQKDGPRDPRPGPGRQNRRPASAPAPAPAPHAPHERAASRRARAESHRLRLRRRGDGTAQARTTTLDLRRGDGLDAMRSLPERSLGVVITDPPFGITNLAWDRAPDAREMLDVLHRAVREDGAVIVFASGKFTQAVMAAAGPRFRYKLVWHKKGRPTGGLDCRRRPLRIHEDILVLGERMPAYFPVMSSGGRPYRVVGGEARWGAHWRTVAPTRARVNNGERYPLDVLDFERPPRSERIHPTQKPVPLLELLTRLYSREGETVGDPFMGSGSCARACLRTGRSFVGAETDRSYMAAARRSIEAEAAALGLAACR